MKLAIFDCLDYLDWCGPAKVPITCWILLTSIKWWPFPPRPAIQSSFSLE